MGDAENALEGWFYLILIASEEPRIMDGIISVTGIFSYDLQYLLSLGTALCHTYFRRENFTQLMIRMGRKCQLLACFSCSGRGSAGHWLWTTERGPLALDDGARATRPGRWSAEKASAVSERFAQNNVARYCYHLKGARQAV